MSQLNESILLTEFQNIKNSDFRKTRKADLDDWEIEYKSDFFYKPFNEAGMTFLGYPVSSASFFVKKNIVEKFGIRVALDNAEEFYNRMVKQYGDYSVCSPSREFFASKGYVLPKENNKEAQELIANLPVPELVDYKNLTSITWYDVEHENNCENIMIKVYNIPQNGTNFQGHERMVRIVFSIQE